ncbi:alkaline phosphatase [Rubellimicrobium aerolatum]|uniref:Alkaline phosphatase n=1 Tax=Rubellimicrobium aerolatum TaxID=490979 RepID=A0ABW0SEI1_9RHOB|nr:alkaline phosphatase [Rubellimicrobium aerolatum]MBP1806864.1 alkaline phosphatase [Rubellimicrobium aerolatum]
MKTSAIAIAAALLGTAVTAQEAAPAAGVQDAASAAVAQAGNAWFARGAAAVAARAAVPPNTGTARNVILFVGDGMGIGTNYAIRLFEGQQQGGLGDDHVLSYEAFPYAGLVKTYSTNGQTPDSAPTATAMNTGVKTKNDVIGVADNVAVDDCAAGMDPANQLTTFSEIATARGKSVGIVSTARITHATPAAVFAHTVNRDWESDAEIPEDCAQPDIAVQLFDAMRAGEIDLALGGGREHFLPEGATDDEGEAGARADGRDLVAELTALGGQYAWDQESFDALTAGGNAPVLGLFEASHMMYEADRADEPSLVEMTEAAIGALEGNGEGYYLMVESGRIDHANHAGNLYRTVTDGVAFAQAVARAVELTDPAETLIIVTADHEHALAFNGYCGRGSSMVGLCMDIDIAGEAHTGEPVTADDGQPYTVAGYLNGPGSILVEHEHEHEAAPAAEAAPGAAPVAAPGAAPVAAPAQPTATTVAPSPAPSEAAADLADAADSAHPELARAKITEAMATDPEYLQQALIPLESETHSGEDVAVWATGPWAHLLTGTIEQNEIFHVMSHAIAPR